MENNFSVLQALCPELSMPEIERIARDTGFIIRQRKIPAEHFLTYLCHESIKGTVSNKDLAVTISIQENISASRQAFFYKTKEQTLSFLKEILAFIIKKTIIFPY